MPRKYLNDAVVRSKLPTSGQVDYWDTALRGFGLRMGAGGTRTYFVMRRINGKMVRRTIGKALRPDETPVGDELSLEDAREAAGRALRQFARGIDPKAVADEAARLEAEGAERARLEEEEAAANTFGNVAARYFADPSKRGGKNLRSRTELERKVRVDLAAWKHRPIASIKRSEVAELIEEKAAEAPVAANRLLAFTHRVFRWAVRKGIIETNPAHDMDPPTEETARDRVLTLGELRRVWSAANAIGYPVGHIVQLLMLTAQRRGEVAGLVWPEIDGGAWRLPDARAKRGQGHLVPLSSLAVGVIQSIPRQEGTDLLFTSRQSNRKEGVEADVSAAPVSGWSKHKLRIDRLIAEAAANDAGEPLDMKRHALPHWTLHDIRRSVSTHLRDEDSMGEGNAVERLTISKILNHAEAGMTHLYDRYSASREKREALEAWSERVKRLVGLNVVDLGSAAPRDAG